MDQKLLNLYLSRILSGFYIFVYNNTKYKLIYPDISIKYIADVYAQEEYENNKFNDWISEDDILYFLIESGLWRYDGDKNLKSLESQMDDIKINLFKNFLNPAKIKSLRKNLDNIKKQYNKLYEIRHCLDHITASGYSSLIRNQYILTESIYDINNNKIFNDIKNIDFQLLNEISNIVSQNNIDIPSFRTIARSDTWRNYWSANKENIFDKATVNWTDEQKTLVVLTKMYDSAYEHPDCPPDSVFSDDDMFDGWMLIQKQENEKNKNKNRTEKMFDNKLGKAQEVFVMANSKDEAQNIYNLNDINSQNIIKERNTVILSSNKDIEDSKLPDVHRNLIAENNKKFMESRKK